MIKSRLKVLMAERDIRQDELSEVTGISKTALSNMANNKTTGIQYDILDKLAIYFGVELNELLVFQRDEPDDVKYWKNRALESEAQVKTRNRILDELVWDYENIQRAMVNAFPNDSKKLLRILHMEIGHDIAKIHIFTNKKKTSRPQSIASQCIRKNTGEF